MDTADSLIRLATDPIARRPDMPKERFHILLALESLRLLRALTPSRTCAEQVEHAYLLGTVFPDALFYDVPSFRLSSLGRAMHIKKGKGWTSVLEGYLKISGGKAQAEEKAWLLGMMGHWATDDFWHPVILRLSSSSSQICSNLRLSTQDCHHWLESEIEAFWLRALGPSDGYLPLLKSLQKDEELIAKSICYFRKLVKASGLPPPPSIARIRRCLFWQFFFTRQFAHPFWNRWKSRLLSRRFTRPVGALIVPTHSRVPILLTSTIQENKESLDLRLLLDGKFMAKAVMFLASRLHALPAPF